MKQFEGVDGEKMFTLDKNKIEEYCGAKEGARLYSQITVQRNVSGVSENHIASSNSCNNIDMTKGITG